MCTTVGNLVYVIMLWFDPLMMVLCGPKCRNVQCDITTLIQKVSTVLLLKKKSSKVSYKILLLSDSTFFKLFFHIFATIIEALIVVGHKCLYTLLIECGRLRC